MIPTLVLFAASLCNQTQIEAVVTEPQNTTVVAQPYAPIEFTFQMSPKEGWEATDKVQAVTSAWTTSSPALQYRKVDEKFFCWAPPGNYTLSGNFFLINWTKQDIDQRQYNATITVIGAEPDPDPDPDPDPQPSELPFETTGLTILIFKEAKETASLPPSQRSIFTSARFLQFAHQYCTVIADRKAVRIWDDDYTEADFVNTSPILRNAYFKVMSSSNFKLPWIAVCDGKRGISQPLPLTVDDTMTLLQPFASSN